MDPLVHGHQRNPSLPTPLQMETASLDKDFGYETLCSMMD